MRAVEVLSAYREFAAKHAWPETPRSNIINDADPTAFNYSMEEPILRRFGDFFRITAPWQFSAVQPCIRTGDFSRLKSDQTDCSHLTLFHIMPIPFNLQPDQSQFKLWHETGIVKPLKFLTESLGLDLARIRLSYFSGGKISDITQGRATSTAYFPPDEHTLATCYAYGMTNEQMIPEASPNTFLCTSPVPGGFYAGYRFEFFYVMPDSSLLEIGTGEALNFRQVVCDGRTTDILPMPSSVCVTALGLERCVFACNGGKTIEECSHIHSLVAEVAAKNSAGNPRSAFLFVDAIRAVHLVVSDGGTYSGLNRHLREHFRALMKRVTSLADDLQFSHDDIRQLLELNSTIQPWLPELSLGVNNTMQELHAYRDRQ